MLEEASGGAGGIGLRRRNRLRLAIALDRLGALAKKVVHFAGLKRCGTRDSRVHVRVIDGFVECVRCCRIIFLPPERLPQRIGCPFHTRIGKVSLLAEICEFAIRNDGLFVLV